MDPIFIWLESTPFSIWLREAPTVWAFPAVLAVHTVGLGIVAGINGALALRILGVGIAMPLAEMKPFLHVMWMGFALNAVSGIALLVAYPTKALTDPVFYLKLTLIAVGLWMVKLIGGRVFGESTPAARRMVSLKTLALVSLASWAGAITAGRLLAYTYRRLMTS